jgi:transposase-like protein
MEMLGRIKRMHVRDNVSVREIAKRTGLSRTTLRKWLKPAEPAHQVKEPVYKRASGGYNKLAPFTDELIQSLKADTHRAKQDRRTGKALFL